jgi:hypothetical protein
MSISCIYIIKQKYKTLIFIISSKKIPKSLEYMFEEKKGAFFLRITVKYE